jgi:hypothetical protein
MLLTYFLNDIEIVPVAPIITGITLVFTFHVLCISVVRPLYFKIFSASSSSSSSSSYYYYSEYIFSRQICATSVLLGTGVE